MPIELGSSDPLWLFYQPAMSGYNGFGEVPHEIVQIKMVKCAINKLIHQTDTHAILAVTPDEIININELEERLPSTRESLNETISIEFFKSSAFVERVTYREYNHISADLEGDVGFWMIYKKTKNQLTLLLLGEWDFHRNYVYAGRNLIDSEVDCLN